MLLGAGHGLAVLNAGQRNALNALLALNVHDRVAQLQWNAEIIETLYNIALQTAGIRHQFGHDLHLRALQRHAARHDEANVAGAQNDHLAAGQVALHVHKALGRAGRVDASGAVAGDIQRTARALPAAHGQDHGFGVQLEQAVLLVHSGHGLVRCQIQHHGVELVGNVQLLRLGDEPGRVLGAGQFFFKSMQAKTVVDALVQNAAQFAVAL